ncbi:Hypothetical predicted protein [Olea europaea subsp. europaea]|uniref:Uncharacterized protein n=1 Tax=Olea europaea subsp. europaea TaxID=158383 RepID=A0A8S0SW07_OLEEU|nr:Hypothetical predicted protein [Olea europaea subsp. europaea]
MGTERVLSIPGPVVVLLLSIGCLHVHVMLRPIEAEHGQPYISTLVPFKTVMCPSWTTLPRTLLLRSSMQSLRAVGVMSKTRPGHPRRRSPAEKASTTMRSSDPPRVRKTVGNQEVMTLETATVKTPRKEKTIVERVTMSILAEGR